MKYVYDFVFFFFALLSLPKFFIRLNQAGSAKALLYERFGFLSRELKQKCSGGKTVWLHAVSVGEVMAARRWIQLFLEAYPDWNVALSTTTPTGQQVGQTLASNRIFVFYAPFDFSFVVKHVLEQMQPQMILLMETEIWPNLISRAHALGIPVGIINGRISPRSFVRYRFVRFLMAPILEKLSFCLVQSAADRERFVKLGVSELQAFYTGNMKFDQLGASGEAEQDKDFRSHGITQNGLIYIGGSTHWGEEELLLRVFIRLRDTWPELQLVLAPRHPEYLSKIVRIVTERNLQYRLFSQPLTLTLSPEGRGKGEGAAVVIVDRMGILGSLYAGADLVFVGGSFVSRGGQNPIEAAFLKKPILHGPNVFNFQEIYQMLDEREAAFSVRSEEELFQKSKMLLESPELRGEMGARAWSTVQLMKGATVRTLDYLASWFQMQESSAAMAH